MKKIFLFLFLILNCIVFAQETTDDTLSEFDKRETLSFKPQIYSYVSHQINSGNNFLSDGHDADFVGFGLQLNLIKYYNFKFGVGWEYNGYEVTNPSTIGNIDNSLYFAMFSKIQYQWDVLDHWSLEPYIGGGATKIQQKYNNSHSDSFYGMNLYAGINVVLKINPHIAFFTGFNYNHLRFNIDTTKKWQDYFNKVSQTQIQLGLIVSIGKND